MSHYKIDLGANTRRKISLFLDAEGIPLYIKAKPINLSKADLMLCWWQIILLKTNSQDDFIIKVNVSIPTCNWDIRYF